MTAEYTGESTNGGALTVICSGRIVDPSAHRDEVGDLWIQDGHILDQGPAHPDKEAVVIDATNRIVLPGLIDMHVHLNEPGYEYRETIKTGALAAAAGGWTLGAGFRSHHDLTGGRPRERAEAQVPAKRL